ncbi:hypothetical protein BC831DRAFT_548432 [Entophlyctis helioformis]|nr:hypothetical protein BC831DRAFT_548432 [Entophlyctis helioformis]
MLAASRRSIFAQSAARASAATALTASPASSAGSSALAPATYAAWTASATAPFVVSAVNTRLQSRSVNVFSEFAKSVRRQVEENKDFQQNVKLLSDETTKIAESDAVARTREAMSKTSETTSKVLKTVGEVVDKTLETPAVKMTGEVIYKTAETVADISQKVAEPIKNTAAAKAISSSIREVTESSSNAFYAEYKPKELREKERQEWLEIQRKNIRPGSGPDPTKPVLPNPEAGGNVVLHRSSRMAESWRKFAEESTIGRTMFAARRSVEESNNPIIERMRNLFSRTNVEESEQARVVRAFRAVDPYFTLDGFLKEATRYTIPEIVEAYLKGDVATIKEWASEAAFAKLTVGFEAQKQQGLISDSKLLDIRNVDIRQVTLLNDELPIILVGFVTQEVLLFRNVKGELVLGQEDKIQTANYVMAFTRAEIIDTEAPYNPVTKGWTIVDWARGSAGW